MDWTIIKTELSAETTRNLVVLSHLRSFAFICGH